MTTLPWESPVGPLPWLIPWVPPRPSPSLQDLANAAEMQDGEGM